jgi:hypothetical protein
MKGRGQLRAPDAVPTKKSGRYRSTSKIGGQARLNNIKNSVRTSNRTQFTTTKINWLMMFREITTVYSDDYTKRI